MINPIAGMTDVGIDRLPYHKRVMLLIFRAQIIRLLYTRKQKRKADSKLTTNELPSRGCCFGMMVRRC